jgi:hypothetical protein
MNDTQHNDTQHYDTQHKGTQNKRHSAKMTLSIMALSKKDLFVIQHKQLSIMTLSINDTQHK